MLQGLPHSNELGWWSGHSWSSSTASSLACTSCAGSSCGTFSAATVYSCDPVMMHRCMWLCKWYIRWDVIWWSWLHAIQINMFSFIRQCRCKTLLLGSQHHPRTCTISTCYLLHSLLPLTTTMHPNYHKATNRCTYTNTATTILTCQVITAS
jgi:hypothetical protein